MIKSAQNFHMSRRAFIMWPRVGFFVAPNNMNITHEQMFQKMGIGTDDIKKLLMIIPRGYFMKNYVVVYQGIDMTPGAIWCVSPQNYSIVRNFIPDLRREFGVTDDTVVWMGVRVGAIGTVWEKIYKTNIKTLEK